MAPADPCLDEQRALELVSGGLPPCERATAHTHMAGCPACAALVADLARVLHDDGSDPTPSSAGADPGPTGHGSESPLERGLELDELAALPRGAEVGPFRVRHPLAAGGMGVVYVADDPRLGRTVALKLLRADLVEPGAATRLRREALALAQLHSPHVVIVLAAGDSPHGVWVAMELVQGQTLAAWLRRAPAGGWPWRQVLAHFTAAARGLRDAHAAGLVHRDFKPSNVLLGDDGRVRVVDFGLAAAHGTPTAPAVASDQLELGDELGRITRTGGVVGTPAYMAPEQLAGRAADARSDQFSLCVALFEALHGVRPYPGQTLAALLESLERGQVRPPETGRRVPSWLHRAIVRGLHPDPARRHPDLDALLEALDPAARRRRRQRLGALAVAAVGVPLVVLLGAGDPAAPACDDVDVRLRAVWSDAERTAVGRAFLATALPEAPRQLATVTRALDARAEAWRTAQGTACAATQRTQADPHLDQRLQCLQTALDETEAAIESLAAADAGTVRRADTVLPSLTAIADCDDPEFLDAVLERPEDPAAAATIAALRRDVARARTQLAATRDLDAAVARFTALHEQARTLAYAPLVVSTALSLGRALALRGDAAEAVEQLQPAYFGAQQLGDHGAAFSAALQLAQARGHGQGQLDEALRWTRHAEAAARAEADPADQAVALLVRGELLLAHGRDDEAERTLVAAWEELPPEAPPRRRASLAETLGNVYASRWDCTHALPYYDEALALQERRVGPDHHDVLRALNGRAVCLVQLERFAEAEAALERALAIATASGSYTAGPAAQLATNLGTLLQQRGDLTGALARYLDAVAKLEAIYGPDHDETLSALYNVANTERQLERCDEALAHATQGIERGLAREPPAPAMPIKLLSVQAECHRVRGEPGLAAQALRRRLALRREHAPDDAEAIAEDEAALAELESAQPAP